MSPRWPFRPRYPERDLQRDPGGRRGEEATALAPFTSTFTFCPPHPQHPEQWPILLCQRPITGPVAWQRRGTRISTTCTALKSKESGLASCTHSGGGGGEGGVKVMESKQWTCGDGRKTWITVAALRGQEAERAAPKGAVWGGSKG